MITQMYLNAGTISRYLKGPTVDFIPKLLSCVVNWISMLPIHHGEAGFNLRFSDPRNPWPMEKLYVGSQILD